jgi:two-component sensor histidine kinase
LKKNKILIAQNIHTNSSTEEFTIPYSIPNNIISLMDIPLRIASELVGVMCFEKTGEIEKKFSNNEQTFAFSISLVFASNLEARHRRAAQHKLTAALKEKELLIKEINHRVKNNFSILISLLRISKEQGLTNDPKILLEEYEHRIFSMMKIQDLLFETENYSEVKISAYLNELVKEFKSSHPELSKNINATIETSNYSIESKSALHIGLIVTEIFLNSVKHSATKGKEYSLELNFKKETDNFYLLELKDNGPGFDFEEKLKKNTLGLPLIKDLADDMKFISLFPTELASKYTFKIPV